MWEQHIRECRLLDTQVNILEDVEEGLTPCSGRHLFQHGKIFAVLPMQKIGAAASPERPGARGCTALPGLGWSWTEAAGWSRVAPPDPALGAAGPVEQGGVYKVEPLSPGAPLVGSYFGPVRSCLRAVNRQVLASVTAERYGGRREPSLACP